MAKQTMTVSELQEWRKRRFMKFEESVSYPDFACSYPESSVPLPATDASMPLARRSKRKRGTVAFTTADADVDEDCTVVDVTDTRSIVKSDIPGRRSKALRSVSDNSFEQPGINSYVDDHVVGSKNQTAVFSNAEDQNETKKTVVAANNPQACSRSSNDPQRNKRLASDDHRASQEIESEAVQVLICKTEKNCYSPSASSVVEESMLDRPDVVEKKGRKPLTSKSLKSGSETLSANDVRRRKRDLSPDVKIQSTLVDKPGRLRGLQIDNPCLANPAATVSRPATVSPVNSMDIMDVDICGATVGQGTVDQCAYSSLLTDESMHEHVSISSTAKKVLHGHESESKVSKDKATLISTVPCDSSSTVNSRKRARTGQMGAVVVSTNLASRHSIPAASSSRDTAAINRQSQVTACAIPRATRSRRNERRGSTTEASDTIPCVSSDEEECVITSQQPRPSRKSKAVLIPTSGSSASSTSTKRQSAQMERDAEYARQLQAQFDREAALERDSDSGNSRSSRSRHGLPSSSADATAALDYSPRTASLLHMLSPEAPPPSDLFSRHNQQLPTDYMDRLETISHRINSMRLLLNMSNEEQQQYHNYLADADLAVNGSRLHQAYLQPSTSEHFSRATSRDLDQGVVSLLRSHRGPSHRMAFGRFYHGSSRNSHHAASSHSIPTFHAETDDYEALLELADLIGEVKRRGLSEVEIQVLPTRIYSQRVADCESSDEAAADTCHICFDKFQPEERLRILPCSHEYHIHCIDEWIKRNATCPICRMEVQLD